MVDGEWLMGDGRRETTEMLRQAQHDNRGEGKQRGTPVGRASALSKRGYNNGDTAPTVRNHSRIGQSRGVGRAKK